MLSISNLYAEIEGKEILKGVNLMVKAGEVHAIMGPNGSGKSTLARIVAGHPHYSVTAGNITYEVNKKSRSLFDLATDERAKEGIFLAFQYPVEIPGVTNAEFLRTSFNAVCGHQGVEGLDPMEFHDFIQSKLELVKLDGSFLERPVNSGFSGGEKKKNEILQMALLNPRVAILDETDSGLDIDALKIVADGVNSLRNSKNAIVLITHYQRLLNYIRPDFVHVFAGGKIVKTGGADLAITLERQGYDWLIQN
jgi:Fe-S cluster assembly ATP-binding protein